MPRFLITEQFSGPPPEINSHTILIAPHSRVGRMLGAPALTIQNCAKEFLKKNGFGIATPIKAADALRRTVHSILPRSDSSAVARHLCEMIGAILRSGIDIDKLASVGSNRRRTVARIA